MFKIHLTRFPRPLILAIVVLTIFGAYSTSLFAQQTMTAQTARAQSSTAEVSSLCNPKKVEKSARRGKTTFSCEGKKPTPRPGAQANYKAAGDGGLRSDINCSYSESGGVMKWLGCSCTADDESNCTGFITWCADQGDEVSGNSGGASCSPGG